MHADDNELKFTESFSKRIDRWRNAVSSSESPGRDARSRDAGRSAGFRFGVYVRPVLDPPDEWVRIDGRQMTDLVAHRFDIGHELRFTVVQRCLQPDDRLYDERVVIFEAFIQMLFEVFAQHLRNRKKTRLAHTRSATLINSVHENGPLALHE